MVQRLMKNSREPRNRSTHTGQQVFDKGSKYTVEKPQSLLTNVLRKLHNREKRIKLDLYLIPYTKINSKWIKVLKVKTGNCK